MASIDCHHVLWSVLAVPFVLFAGYIAYLVVPEVVRNWVLKLGFSPMGSGDAGLSNRQNFISGISKRRRDEENREPLSSLCPGFADVRRRTSA
jgi:hypothetical protein